MKNTQKQKRAKTNGKPTEKNIERNRIVPYELAHLGNPAYAGCVHYLQFCLQVVQESLNRFPVQFDAYNPFGMWSTCSARKSVDGAT